MPSASTNPVVARTTRRTRATPPPAPAPSVPPHIRAAIRSGYVPKDLESWKTKPLEDLTKGEKVCRFAQEHLVVPEGALVGKPLVLDDYQVAFILALFDGPVPARKGILSVARRNGKTATIGAILCAYIVGPLATPNSLVALAAMSREQAGLAYRLMSLMLANSPSLKDLYRAVPSAKRIFGLRRNVELETLSRDARTGHGRGIKVLMLDEAGQIEAPVDDYIEMLTSSLGSYDDSLHLIISTQAPSDAAYFSREIDIATLERPEDVVCHVYCASPDAGLEDEDEWARANPGMGKYRSAKDIRDQAQDAKRMPAREAGFRNLILNQRITRQELAFSPMVWAECGGPVDLDVFRRSEYVSAGLDLSQVIDLTAVVLAAKDEDRVVHLLPYVFTPSDGMDARARRDRAPYDQWVREGHLVAVPGRVVDYEYVFEYMRIEMDRLEIRVDEIAFDRWRITQAKKAAEVKGFAPSAIWREVGQGFVSMSPLIEAFERLLLQTRIRHGKHPLLAFAASNAIITRDAAGNRKLDKSRSLISRIDPLVAAVMAAGPHATEAEPWSAASMIG